MCLLCVDLLNSKFVVECHLEMFFPKNQFRLCFKWEWKYEYQECHEHFDEGLTFTLQYGVNMVDVYMDVPGWLCLHYHGCSLQRTRQVSTGFAEHIYCCWWLHCLYVESQPEDICRQTAFNTDWEQNSSLCSDTDWIYGENVRAVFQTIRGTNCKYRDHVIPFSSFQPFGRTLLACELYWIR